MTGHPIAYIDRTRAYYRALGYGAPYDWAQLGRAPFAPPGGDLARLRVAIVSTAAPYQPGKGDQGPGAPYNAAAKFHSVQEGATRTLPDLRISHVAIDRDHTSAEDIGTYFPLTALRRAEAAGRIGTVADRFFLLPTNRSQRITQDVDCPDLVARCRRHGVEAALLVPNCPVCHQSVALAARALEVAGIATVIMGCALDIVLRVGVPRFLFSDFPLGNSAGRPGDVASQDRTLALALDLLERARSPNTTWHSPLVWPGDRAWKDDYANPARLSPAEITRRRAAFDAAKAVAKSGSAARGKAPRR